jgi:hypothetical protein
LRQFVARRDEGSTISTDQLLNAVYLATSHGLDRQLDDVVDAVLRPLT